MKLCNETVTVFNKRLDIQNGWDVYVPTVIKGVSWYCEIASNVDNTGLHAANRYTLRIPIDADFGGKAYLDPIAYAKEMIVSGVFTLRNGDIVARAAITDESLTPAQLHDMYECMTILGVTDNRRAPNAPHFKVVGS